MIPEETVQSQKKLGLAINPHTSDFRVMRSNAGYYIGTAWINCGECEECKDSGLPKGYEEPGSRETEYFETSEEAEKALEGFKKTGELEGDRSE